jgi:hypothetical protein
MRICSEAVFVLGAIFSEGVSRVTHNPVTHAVEVRPQVSPGVGKISQSCSDPVKIIESDPSVMLDYAPGESSLA